MTCLENQCYSSDIECFELNANSTFVIFLPVNDVRQNKRKVSYVDSFNDNKLLLMTYEQFAKIIKSLNE